MDTNRIELTMVEMSMEEKPCLLQILTFSPINKLHIWLFFTLLETEALGLLEFLEEVLYSKSWNPDGSNSILDRDAFVTYFSTLLQLQKVFGAQRWL